MVNATKKLEFRDANQFLMRLREIERSRDLSGVPKGVITLRTRALKEWREAREAALFCAGIACRMGSPVYFARSESHDYDFIASWIVEDTQNFAPVQLKEVVPTDINPRASVQVAVDALRAKYVDSKDLTVAIHLNQGVSFSSEALSVQNLNIAALWVFGAISPDQTEWALWGDFLNSPIGTRFAYPSVS